MVPSDANGTWDVFVRDRSPSNQPPLADANGPYVVDEGGVVALDGTGSSDPDGDGLSFAWDFDLDGLFDDASGATPSFSTAMLDGPAILNVALRVDDGIDQDTDTAVVAVNNLAPVVGAITVPETVVLLGTPISASAFFSDAGLPDTHTAVWDWGDGTTTDPASLTQGMGSGSVADDHSYALAGVYTITLTVTDDDDGAGVSTFETVTVFDPDAGFVTGAGRIASPAGAYPANPALTGTANFRFTINYTAGDLVPTGNAGFRFAVAGLNFSSSGYEWLVVDEAEARFQGAGTIKGRPGTFTFEMTVMDGEVAGATGPDGLRLQVRDTGGALVYDNAPGGGSPALGGGVITIHTTGPGA